jgi:hypothetical protein
MSPWVYDVHHEGAMQTRRVFVVIGEVWCSDEKPYTTGGATGVG